MKVKCKSDFHCVMRHAHISTDTKIRAEGAVIWNIKQVIKCLFLKKFEVWHTSSKYSD